MEPKDNEIIHSTKRWGTAIKIYINVVVYFIKTVPTHAPTYTHKISRKHNSLKAFSGLSMFIFFCLHWQLHGSWSKNRESLGLLFIMWMTLDGHKMDIKEGSNWVSESYLCTQSVLYKREQFSVAYCYRYVHACHWSQYTLIHTCTYQRVHSHNAWFDKLCTVYLCTQCLQHWCLLPEEQSSCTQRTASIPLVTLTLIHSLIELVAGDKNRHVNYSVRSVNSTINTCIIVVIQAKWCTAVSWY